MPPADLPWLTRGPGITGAAAALALIAAAGPAPAAEALPVVRGTLDFAAAPDSPERSAAEAFLAAFPPPAPVIYLDLTLVPPAADTDTPLRALAPDMPGARALVCEAGSAGPMGDDLALLGIEVGPLYTHLRLEVGLAAPHLAPFNGLVCAYSPGSGPREAVIRLRGFFAVHTYAVPTALGVRLQPVTPPLEQALATLGPVQ